MSFITNITGTGVPITGTYGTDGNPSGINNDGGIEVTPQDGRGVPSAGTESRISGDNDKILSGNPYNQSASSTDSQAIGPSSSNPNMGNRYSSDSQRLFNSQFRNDSLPFPLEQPYALGSFDHYKNESPAGSIDPVYESSYNIAANSVNIEGSVIGSFVYDSSGNVINGPVTRVTTSLGGMVLTSAPSRGTIGGGPNGGVPLSCEDKASGIIDNPCEISQCAGGAGNVPLGKKMRVFKGQGCEKSGYWVQQLITTDGYPEDKAHDVGINCDNFIKTKNHTVLNLLPNQSPTESGPGVPICGQARQKTSCMGVIAALAGISGTLASAGSKFYSHRLMYVGTSLGGIKNKEWCDFSSADGSGHREWFFEGAKCNADGTRNATAHSGKLYGCCCKAGFGAPAYGQASGYTLTETSSITINTSDDPCDCKRRYNAGAKFLPQWNGANADSDINFRVLMTGCTKQAATDIYNDVSGATNLFAIAPSFAPTWSEAQCAWIHRLQQVAPCSGGETIENPDPKVIQPIKSIMYCPYGSVVEIADRELFYSPLTTPNYYGLSERPTINYAWCATGNCSGIPCVTGASEFDVGDYVKINSAIVSGYTYNVAELSFDDGFSINFASAGQTGTNPHSSATPFPTGCGDGNASACFWTFEETGAGGPQNPGTGHWVLSSSGLCCDCNATRPSSGLQPNGEYIANDTDGVSYDCNTSTSGCNILTQSWKITKKQYGNNKAIPDSLDCTWGYTIEFTGCASAVSNGSGLCSTTGYGPTGAYQYIPASYFTSGTAC